MGKLRFFGLGAIVLSGVLASIVLTQPSIEPAAAVGPVGDVNCDGSVTAIDAALVLQRDAGLITSLPCPQKADTNGDGRTTAVDAALILQYEAGLIGRLPPMLGVVGDVDCNGRADSIDSLSILQLQARLVTLLPCEHNGDVNRDGLINAIDAALLIKFLVEPWLR